MEWIQITFIVILSLILLIKEGLCENNKKNETNGGIMCYVCNSYIDPRCADPFDKALFPLINCTDLLFLDDARLKLLEKENKTQPDLCRKEIQTVTLSGKTDFRIARTCGYVARNKRKFGEEEEEEIVTSEDKCYKKPGTFEVMVSYCTCSTTGCNGVPQIEMNLLTLILTFLTALFGSSSLVLPVVIKN